MRSTRISAIRPALCLDPFPDTELAEQLGVELEIVRARSLGRERSSAPDGTGPAGIALEATGAVLEATGRDKNDIDCIVFSTAYPDWNFPGSGCLLQNKLEVPGIPCLDIRSQCTGFITAIDIARRFVMTGAYDHVLVAAAEVPTHANRYDGRDPDLAILTGDGGAAALVEAVDEQSKSGEILSARVEVDGGLYEQYWCEFPSCRYIGANQTTRDGRAPLSAFLEGRFYPTANLEPMRATALEKVPGIFAKSLADANLDRVDAAIVAHLDPCVEAELSDLIADRVGRTLTPNRAYCLGASLPVALAEALAAGELVSGETVALVTAGAGVSWGSAVIKV